MEKIKKFWISPSPVPLNATKIKIGYTIGSKDYEYLIEEKNGDKKSFQAVVFLMMESKKKSLLPWPLIHKFKNKVKITNLHDDAVQMELPLTVAKRFLQSSEQ